MDTLLQEYQEQLKRTRALKRSLPNETLDDKDRHSIISSMITDLEIAVFCLETGLPASYRTTGGGKIPFDPSVMAVVFGGPNPYASLEKEMDAAYEIGKRHGLKGNQVFAVMKWQDQKRAGLKC